MQYPLANMHYLFHYYYAGEPMYAQKRALALRRRGLTTLCWSVTLVLAGWNCSCKAQAVDCNRRRRGNEALEMQALIIVIIIAVVVVAAVAGAAAARKRRDAMGALAAKLGLHFNPQKDLSIPTRYKFLDKLRAGSNRYAFNILSGTYRDHDITAFDYHYETHSTDSKGHHQTHHHYFSFFILHLPALFPELAIGREGFFSKVAQAFGYDDIDFESHEFSRKFCVRSPDKKFAYDVCNARMIEYLLANDDLTVEIENDSLALSFGSRLSPDWIEPNLNRLVEIRSLMPTYLFSQR